MPIGQSHVQQDNVHSTFRKMNLRFTHAHEVRQFETVRSFLTEHLVEQASISHVIFNEKNLESLSFRPRASRSHSTMHSQIVQALHISKKSIQVRRLYKLVGHRFNGLGS